MENVTRDTRAKGLVDYDTSEDKVQVVSLKKVKSRKGKDKHKSEDTSNSSPILGVSKHSQDRIDRIFDRQQSFVCWKKNSSMMLVSSSSKNAPLSVPALFAYEVALQQLSTLNVSWKFMLRWPISYEM